jgi:serine/threonine-protein kinase
VKPANVLLTGEDEHAYLGDFGLMRSLDPQHPITDSGGWVGTVDFASPEQLSGANADARADVYSLGCVLHAALTGRPPFARGTVPATMLAHLNDAPPRPSAGGAPREFDRVVARALAKEPQDRYPSAGDLGRAALAAARCESVTETERTVAVGKAAAPGQQARRPDAPAGRGPRAAPPAAPAVRGRRAGRASAPAAPALWAGRPDAPAEPSLQAAVPTRTRVRATTDVTALAPGRASRRSRRLRLATLAAAVGLPLAGVITVAVIMLGADGGNDAAAAASKPLAAGEVRAAAEAFARAYESEDERALRRLLTRDVQRVLPAGVPVRGREAVVAAYTTQFRDNATQSYDLEELTASGGRAGRAQASYRVRRAGGSSIEGSIVLGIVRDRGVTRIALIAVTPRS